MEKYFFAVEGGRFEAHGGGGDLRFRKISKKLENIGKIRKLCSNLVILLSDGHISAISRTFSMIFGVLKR